MRHQLILDEVEEVHVLTNALKASMDGINHNTKQIALVLERTANLIIRTLLRAFIALVTCCILVVIIAVASITHMDFRGDTHGIAIGSSSQNH